LVAELLRSALILPCRRRLRASLPFLAVRGLSWSPNLAPPPGPPAGAPGLGSRRGSGSCSILHFAPPGTPLRSPPARRHSPALSLSSNRNRLTVMPTAPRRLCSLRAFPQAAGQVFTHTPRCQQTCRGHRVRATTPLRRIQRRSTSDPRRPRQGHGEWEGVHRRANGSPRSLRRRSRSLLWLTFWSLTNGPGLIRSGVRNSEPPRAAPSRSGPLRPAPSRSQPHPPRGGVHNSDSLPKGGAFLPSALRRRAGRRAGRRPAP